MKGAINIFLVICLAYTLPTNATDLLRPFEASFKIFRKNIEAGRADFALYRLDNGQFIYNMEVNLVSWLTIFYKFHVVEKSHWQQQNLSLQPLEYSYKKSSGKRETQKNVVFDWDNEQAYYSENKKGNKTETTLPLTAETTDKLLYQLNIMRDLTTGRPDMSYNFPDNGKIRNYRFENLGEYPITTPIGKFNSVKLVRQKKGKEKLIFWCARELGYLPVKVEKTDSDGTLTTALLDKIVWTDE